MRILVTGATGFIGKALVERLHKNGHSLVILSRDTNQAQQKLPSLMIAAGPAGPAQFFSWQPETEEAPILALKGVEAVVNLAGEPIASHRWSDAKKQKIMDSRVKGTRNLMKAIVDMARPKPKIIISGSAVGYYGSRGNDILTESSKAGIGFLAEVCQSWENEVFSVLPPETRAVAIRTGVVLGMGGGALEKMLPVFKAGVGGPLGTGRQWMSWIHIDDMIALIEFCLTHQSIHGPVNAVAPHAVTNAEFAKTLAGVLGRPSIVRTPEFALKMAFGRMASTLLESQHCFPERAMQAGFHFEHSRLEHALESLLKS